MRIAKKTKTKLDRRCAWRLNGECLRWAAPPVLVLGAAEDRIVDKEGLDETAAFFATEAVLVPNLAHDVSQPLLKDGRWS